MKEGIEKNIHSEERMLKILVKWIILSAIVGSIVGVIASGFAYVISWVTEFRVEHPLMLLGLPVGGILVAFLYKMSGQENNTGTNMVLDTIRTPKAEMPTVIATLILIATTVTHLFGGSS